MSIPVPTALGRRDRIWPAVLASVAVHAALIAWGVSRNAGAELDLEQKPIVARMVRLGEKKPPQQLPQKPQQAPPPAPEAAPTRPEPAPVAAAPAPTAPVPGAKPAPKVVPVEHRPSAPTPAAPRDRSARLAEILAGQRAIQGRDRPVYGSPDGDVDGDSDEGEAGDRYLADVRRRLRANYTVPQTIPEKELLHLQATVLLYIEPDGRTRAQIEKPSGNPVFDDALRRTLGLTTRLPPPPDAARNDYRSGVTVIFKI